MSLVTLHLTSTETEQIDKFVGHMTDCTKCKQPAHGTGPLRLCSHGTYLACKVYGILKLRPDFAPGRNTERNTLW